MSKQSKEDKGLVSVAELSSPARFGFSKPVLDTESYTSYKAFRVKYPHVAEDGTFQITFTAQLGGKVKSITRPCTQEVWRRVYGRQDDSNPNRLPVGGFSRQADRHYWIYENKETGVIEAITVIPGHYYVSAKESPTNLQTRKDLELIFHGEGSFEVGYDSNPIEGTMLPRVPGDLKAFEMERLVKEMAKTPTVEPGMQITPAFRVESVSGNRVVVTR